MTTSSSSSPSLLSGFLQFQINNQRQPDRRLSKLAHTHSGYLTGGLVRECAYFAVPSEKDLRGYSDLPIWSRSVDIKAAPVIESINYVKRCHPMKLVQLGYDNQT